MGKNNVKEILSVFNDMLKNRDSVAATLKEDDDSQPFAIIKSTDTVEEFISKVILAIHDEKLNLTNAEIVDAEEWDNGFNITLSVEGDDPDFEDEEEDNEKQERTFDLQLATIY